MDSTLDYSCVQSVIHDDEGAFGYSHVLCEARGVTVGLFRH